MNNSTPHAPNSTQKMKMESLDMTQENIKKIGALFPNVITEAKDKNGKLIKAINFDKLKQELANEVVDNSEESYDFTWVGKNKAIVEANTYIRKTLRPIINDEVTPTGKDNNGNPYCSSGSKDFENTENLYIEGDNLDVLKLLQESYLGAVKMIYIDPPYNTGKDFIYNDNFHTSKDKYDEESGMYDDDGNRQFVQNNDSNPRFHSDWCSMMYPRLRLARNLLTDDGVIFISIDDNEVGNLTKICNEVFGESNFVAQMIWQRAFSPKNDAKYISNSHDYVLMYSKNLFDFKIGRLPRTDEANARYSNPDNDPRGVWTSSDVSVKTYNPDYDYEITTPSGRIVEPPTGRCWRTSKEAFNKLIAENRIYFGEDGNNAPRIKRFLTELKFEGMAPTSIMLHKDVGHSQEGSQEVTKLLEAGAFDGPKPIRLINRLLTLANTDKDSIVLDFFSGSATTAHAVMQLNAEDNARQAGTGNRKFIMVQLPEVCDEKSEAFKAGYKNICEIGKERIRRAGEKILESLECEERSVELKDEQMSLDNNSTLHTPNSTLDIGFRVLKLDDSNMKDVYYGANEIDQTMLDDMISNIKDDRTDIDLLYGVLLDWGLQLSSKHEILDIDGVRVHNYDDLSLVACFEEKISENVIRKIANMKNSLGMSPLRVVFRDSSFANSPDKINVEEIFKLNAPNTSVRVI